MIGNRCGCGRSLIEADGPANSNLLLLTDAPGFDTYGGARSVFSKAVEALLLQELSKIGVSYYDCRRTLFFKHTPTKECDTAVHKDRLVKELTKPAAVLVMGSVSATEILGVDDDDYYGIVVKHQALPCKFLVAPNPYHVLNGTIGEFRLALKRLKEII